MRIILTVFTLSFLAFSIACEAQTSLTRMFDQLQKGTVVPELIQSTRSAVFIKTNASAGTATNWNALAMELHEKLVDMQIDAVAYYRWRDLDGGFDATLSYLNALSEREIGQIILLVVDNNYQLYMVPTDLESPTLVSSDAATWYTSGSSMEQIMDNLSTTMRQIDLERSNFLISESPEFFVDTPIFRKNRFESYQPDLKLDKLAVPLFYSQNPENIEDPSDLELQSIMQLLYPFKYELVGIQMTEDLMKKAGFQYVLRYLHGEEATMKTLLDYQVETENAERIGYKYYVKHLITGDIFLGDRWDSRNTWQEALSNHLTDMKRTLKVE